MEVTADQFFYKWRSFAMKPSVNTLKTVIIHIVESVTTQNISSPLQNQKYYKKSIKNSKQNTLQASMPSPIKKLFLAFILIINVCSYLEFKLVRVPHDTKVYNYGVVQCLTDIPNKGKKVGKKGKDEDERRVLSRKDDEDEDGEEVEYDEEEMEEEQKKEVTDPNNFKEICYEKDISYSIQLLNKKKQLLLLSIDLTVPISWVKGQKCFITQTHKKCERIENNYREEVSKIAKKFKQLLKNPFRRKPKQKSKSANNNEYALIEGSSEVVKGVLEKTQTLEFITKDSGRLTRFIDLMLLGLFFIGINANLNLQNTTFINATQISPALNYLCDGAISLRFDENSQSSFLKEMTAVAQSQESFVTIFIGEHNQSMTIGDLSVKNAAHGLSGLRWIATEQDEEHGKLPRCQTISLTESNSEINKQIPIKLPLVITLSSSTITIPQSQLENIFSKFFPKKKCAVNETTRYISCQKLSASQIDKKQLNFISNETAIMIPFKNLILQDKKHKITFNIKSSLDERYIILGQPLFKMYFIVLDYTNNRIGLALQRTKFVDALFDAVTLIRFVVWAFLVGVCAIVFLIPAQKCYTSIVNRIITARVSKKKKKNFSGTKDEKSRINTYTSVEQETGYEDLEGKIKEVLGEDEVRGI